MRAIAVKPGQKNSLHLQELEKPLAGAGELLVRVLETGVCGTDMEINTGLYGTAPADYDFLVLGHEAFGQVETVGDNLVNSGWQQGDYVVSTVRRPCHAADPNCQHGRSDMCLSGQYTERGIKSLHGYMTEYYAESVDFAVKVPPKFRNFGVLLEPTSFVEKTIFQIYKIQERLEWLPRRAVIFGAGPIGLLATILLRSKGVEVFTVAHSLPGTDNPKTAWVENCGANYLSSQTVAIEDLHRQLGQIDLMVEATGSSEIAFKAAYSLGINGVMALTSVSNGHNAVPLNTDKLNLQMVIGNQVIFGSVNANRYHFEMGLKSWATIEAKWPGALATLITHRLPFEDFKQAFTKNRNSIKTVIQIV